MNSKKVSEVTCFKQDESAIFSQRKKCTIPSGGQISPSHIEGSMAEWK